MIAEVTDKLIDALIQVESNGKTDIVGDNGRAKGCLQIWNVVIEDVNRIYNTKFIHDDAFSMEKSRDICRRYLAFWGGQYNIRTNTLPTDEVLARIWNGGPSGWAKSATDKYWVKVKAVLEKQDENNA